MALSQQLLKLNVEETAKFLLGNLLVFQTVVGRLAGKIIETEAYHQSDPAAHTFRGQTLSNQAMFGPPGHAYIYFTYGNHFCFNVTAGELSEGAGVLIRALEPLEGIEIMKQRRQTDNILNLCSGPGKLCQAFGIDKSLYGHDLSKPPLFLEPGERVPEARIVTTTRIGISKSADAPLRFYIKNNPYISKR